MTIDSGTSSPRRVSGVCYRRRRRLVSADTGVGTCRPATEQPVRWVRLLQCCMGGGADTGVGTCPPATEQPVRWVRLLQCCMGGGADTGVGTCPPATEQPVRWVRLLQCCMGGGGGHWSRHMSASYGAASQVGQTPPVLYGGGRTLESAHVRQLRSSQSGGSDSSSVVWGGADTGVGTCPPATEQPVRWVRLLQCCMGGGGGHWSRHMSASYGAASQVGQTPPVLYGGGGGHWSRHMSASYGAASQVGGRYGGIRGRGRGDK